MPTDDFSSRADGGDDYGGMREVLRRRFKQGLQERNEG